MSGRKALAPPPPASPAISMTRRDARNRESETRNEAQEEGEMLMCVYIYCVLPVKGWAQGKRREGDGEEPLATPHHNQPSLSLTHDLKYEREGVTRKEKKKKQKRIE